MLDTLGFARRMIASGMPEKTAEALAHALRAVLLESQAATKADLADWRGELRTGFEKLRGEIGVLRMDFENCAAVSLTSGCGCSYSSSWVRCCRCGAPGCIGLKKGLGSGGLPQVSDAHHVDGLEDQCLRGEPVLPGDLD